MDQTGTKQLEVLILANLVANIIPKQLIDLYVSAIKSRQY